MDWTGVLIGAGVGALALFFWQFVCWMVLPFHKADFRRIDASGTIESALESARLEPGLYCLPHMEDCEQGMKDPAYLERLNRGPNAMITVLKPGPPMGPGTLGRGFLIDFAAALLIALFLAWRPGSVEGLWDTVLFCSGCGLFAVVVGHLTMSNWMGVPWRFSLLHLFDDGVGFALVGVALHYLGPTAPLVG